MTPERWQRVRAVFDAAVACSGDEREALLRDWCAGDYELQRAVESLLRADAWSEPLRLSGAGGPPTAPAEDEVLLEPGRTLGRYVVVRHLGTGGMGVVYQARDPALDRPVALKLLRRLEPFGDARSRLLREGQAMARLAHPNVVGVYDVGTLEDRVFIAMEYVHGVTLRQWLAVGPRSWADVWPLFREAGLGLAAAHAAGIVHRDFKPDNVLVGPDGRARVTDFGLARPDRGLVVAVDGGAAGAAGAEPAASTTAAPSLTVPGAVLGTPRYMAPEQRRGEAADARADQFAFCVALHEALYGCLPFEAAGATGGAAMEPGRAAPSGGAPGIAPWRRRTLQRGLSLEPARRFGSMRDLLSALGRDPLANWRRAALLAAGGSLAAAALWLLSGRGPSCSDAAADLRGVWDQARRRQLEERFSATGRLYAVATAERAARGLDRYTQAWAEMRVAACRATHERGVQSEASLDRRMQCLDRRLAEVRALTDVFVGDDGGDALERSVSAVERLSPIAPCADVRALEAAVPPPEDARTRERVEGLRVRLAEARAARDAGVATGGPGAGEVVRAAREIGYPPLLGEALRELGDQEMLVSRPEQARIAFEEAIRVAARAKDDSLSASVWSRLIHAMAEGENRPAEALALRSAAEAAVIRADDEPRLRTALLSSLGNAYRVLGDLAPARELVSAALEIQERERPHQLDHRATLVHNLAEVYSDAGEYPEALERYEDALRLRRELLGDLHPEVGETLNSVGVALRRQGRPGEALERYREAAAIFEGAFGETHGALARVEMNTGNVLRELGRHEEARAHCQRALAAFEKLSGADSADTAMAIMAIGNLDFTLGDLDGARAAFEQVRDVYGRTLGPDHPDTARAAVNVGSTLLEQGRYAEALPFLEEARPVFERRLGSAHPALGVTLGALASAHLGAGNAGEALPLARRSLSILESASPGTGTLAEAQYTLARALWDSGDDRVAAIALAETARLTLTRAEGDFGDLADELAAWLAEREAS